MTLPPDPTPPVFLPEPPRRPGEVDPNEPPPPPSPPPPRRAPKTLDEPPLHPDWSKVLKPGEDVVWQGRPRTSPAAPRTPSNGMVFLILAALAFMAVAGDSPLPVVFGIVLFLLIRRRQRRSAASVPPQRYVLTNRAAYSAREDARGLAEVACCPLDGADEPRTEARRLRFDRPHGGDRVEFDDIDDVDDVLDLIRQLRRGRD